MGQFMCLLFFLLHSSLVRPQSSEGLDIPSSRLKAEHRGDDCDCMEYWKCIVSGGSPYSYCGLSETSVCCVVPENASPINSFVPDEPSTASGKPKCGVKGFDSGKEGVAEPSEWPWHVAIVEEPGFFYVCGGTLIDEFWVLTAAHCLANYVTEYNNAKHRLKVRLGEYDVTSTKENLPHEDRGVAEIVLHPDFNNETLAADIGLARLDRKASQRPHVDVVCLPSLDGGDGGGKCVVTGWGRQTQGSGFSEVLKEIPLPLWERSRCEGALRAEFGGEYQLPNTTLCAGQQGADACDGDGGGPLVCQREGQWFQVGIVSFGVGCGVKNAPGVYTSVRHYEKWIRETVLLSTIQL